MKYIGALERRLPSGDEGDPSVLLDRFMAFVEELELELYPAQEEAILEVFDGKNVILNTPTGSGKSLVALALHFKSMAQGRRSVYTCPIKALVNEKFMDLCRFFGPENVGIMTGDASVNRKAPILCCTAEILANIALSEGAASSVREVVIDEFHYYSDRDRGAAWQVPLLTLSQARFLLMSATLGETAFFKSELTRLTQTETALVQSFDRPVPLEFNYEALPLEQVLENLVLEQKAPVYVVHFTQMEAAQNAQNFMSLNFCSKEEKQAISEAIQEVRFISPYGKELRKYLKHGIGIHHAGLLPRYRVLVERLAQKGLLKVICGTDTLGVGVNVPIRTVLLTRLCKYDGDKTALLTVRDFHQICGRAGRKGFDDRGWVVAMAPEHEIENLKLKNKAGNDPKKLRKIVKRKPPERGYVPWTKETFERLISSTPESLVSRFQITHGMLLNVLNRKDDGCRVMRQLIRDCHESVASKKQLRRRAWQLFRSMLDKGIIELNQAETPGHARIKVNVDLQEDFSLNQALSLYLIDTLPLLDKEQPDYALDVLTLVESILEDPFHILRKQLDKVKEKAIAEMKAEGMDYDQRMEELEKLEYPKPNRDFIYSTFNEFSAQHPWVGQENIRPKSIAREMFEEYMAFDDYVRVYQLNKVEGVLLRYLSEVYKALNQTVPDAAKTPEVRELILYFEMMIRQTDSSLLEEWEKMKNPGAYVARKLEKPDEDLSVKREKAVLDPIKHRRPFEIMMRNQIFAIVRCLASNDYEGACERLSEMNVEEPIDWSPDTLRAKLSAFYDDHNRVRLDADARNPIHTRIEGETGEAWKIRQSILDDEEHNDWALYFEVDLNRSRTEERPIMTLMDLSRG